jgi:hypothetical protein
MRPDIAAWRLAEGRTQQFDPFCKLRYISSIHRISRTCWPAPIITGFHGSRFFGGGRIAGRSRNAASAASFAAAVATPVSAQTTCFIVQDTSTKRCTIVQERPGIT